MSIGGSYVNCTQIKKFIEIKSSSLYTQKDGCGVMTTFYSPLTVFVVFRPDLLLDGLPLTLPPRRWHIPLSRRIIVSSKDTY